MVKGILAIYQQKDWDTYRSLASPISFAGNAVLITTDEEPRFADSLISSTLRAAQLGTSLLNY